MDDARSSYNSTTSMVLKEATHDEAFVRIKKLIGAIEEYIETRAEDRIIIINKYLQALSLTLDLSIFDPHTNLAGKFFISLYDLMNVLEARSLTSWYCVDVLTNTCKNHAARTALIKTYQFLPSLARLIGDQISTDKKIRLLRLIQDITCGIKIHWQIPHINHLISVLCNWIERAEPDLVTLSLGVLINLCYKNVSTIYLLQRNIDLKRFIRMCLALKGPLVELYVCQISIILENITGYVPEEIFPKLIDCTFVATIEAFRKTDSILLRQIIEFFIESVKNNHKDSLNIYRGYHKNIDVILDMIDASNVTHKDPECIYVTLEFIHFLIEMKVPEISAHYLKLISIALKWIQENTVSYQALAVLRTIAINTDKKDVDVMKALTVGLPMFLLLLNSCKEDTTTLNSEYNVRLGALLQLLTTMICVEDIAKKLKGDLHEEVFRKIFCPLLGDESPRCNEDSCSIESVNLYIDALTFLTRLVDCDKNWMGFTNSLLANRQVHVIVAKAICQSPSNVKKLALEISSRTTCVDGVSTALSNFQSIILGDKDNSNGFSTSSTSEFAYSLFSVRQNERLDNILEKVETLVRRNDIANSSTSDLMELYNYKISYLAQAERTALASVEASTRHCSHLQHRLTRLMTEQSQLQQSEYYTIQKLEESVKKQGELRTNIKELHNKLESEKGKAKAYYSQLTLKEKALEESEASLNEVSSKLAKMTKSKNDTEDQLTKLKQVLSKVEENYNRLEKNLKKKEETLQIANNNIANYTMQIRDLENELAEKQKRLENTQAALQTKSAILESITKMANSQL